MITDRQWSTGIVNSVQVALLTAVLATVLGTLAALGLARGRFPGGRSSTAWPSRR